jgi:hypothetical protein
MALANTSGAIGAVTRGLVTRIAARSGLNVIAGRPDQNTASEHLNLFLYEISYDPTLRNFSLDEGQKPPLWMVLKYVLTAFDTGGNSDSPEAHINLGRALRAIYEDDLLRLDGLPGNIVQALESNPEELNVTFDESSVELLARLMQGTDERLRISIAFQVRPVMIAPTDVPDYSLLVGIDYTQPPTSLTSNPVEIDVIPSLGAFIEEIVPKGFEAGEEVSIKGTDLHLSNLSVRLGTVDLPVTMQQPDELRFRVDAALINAAGMSAGSHPLTVVQTLASGKRRASNMLVANLVPTLATAVVVLPVLPETFFAAIDLTGVLLGDESDDTVLALYGDGRVFSMFDVLTLPPAPPATPQTARRLVIEDAVPAGEYLTILRVNGQQAPQSPRIIIV